MATPKVWLRFAPKILEGFYNQNVCIILSFLDFRTSGFLDLSIFLNFGLAWITGLKDLKVFVNSQINILVARFYTFAGMQKMTDCVDSQFGKKRSLRQNVNLYAKGKTA